MKILRGTEGPGSIGEYLGVSKHTVYKYIGLGMPVEIILGTYHAHTDNISDWFKKITRKQYLDVPQEDRSIVTS